MFSLVKLKYSQDVGDVSRDGRVTTELNPGSLGHAVGILALEYLRP